MPKINQFSIVGYSAQQMYQLVNNYRDYPEFLPGCVASETIDNGECELTAKLIINKAGIRQSFITYNTMQLNEEIRMNLVDGPFRRLTGMWKFEKIDDASCYIHFNLDFEFSNVMVGLVFGKIFNQLTRRMVDAFKTRAKEVYGE